MLSDEEKGAEEERSSRWERKRENQLLAKLVFRPVPWGPMGLPQFAGMSTPRRTQIMLKILPGKSIRKQNRHL